MAWGGGIEAIAVGTYPALSVDLSPGGQQQLRHLCLAVERSMMQRGPTILHHRRQNHRDDEESRDDRQSVVSHSIDV